MVAKCEVCGQDFAGSRVDVFAAMWAHQWKAHPDWGNRDAGQ